VKYQLIDMATGDRPVSGIIERIGERSGRLVHTPATGETRTDERPFADQKNPGLLSTK
jgi:acetate kinase